MAKRCIICDSEVKEENEKMNGTIVKSVENKKTKFVYVCSQCQKEPKWLEKAKVKAV